jgi:hypothetical protein
MSADLHLLLLYACLAMEVFIDVGVSVRVGARIDSPRIN